LPVDDPQQAQKDDRVIVGDQYPDDAGVGRLDRRDACSDLETALVSA
jgi:hypothetical protein